ncbi:hypothetical protein BaRGS_00028342 [Batillaria attramentaria]|uniref:IGFBP N-terminal domain-containing protein n=1 Tax=Batillaria attramentaria TaxID=370345 RepID=A0ABD0JZS9_9CAEN
MAVVKGFCLVAVTVVVINTLTPMTASADTVNRALLRKFFQCPVCDPFACPAPSVPGCEMVLEPGVCGCCRTCAKREGDLCGLGSGRCGKGLACRPLPNDPDPIGAILNGRALQKERIGVGATRTMKFVHTFRSLPSKPKNANTRLPPRGSTLLER